MYATFVLHGEYRAVANGAPLAGYVDIVPSAWTIKDTVGDVILTGRSRVRLDANGEFSVTLPDPNDTTLAPHDFGYIITAHVGQDENTLRRYDDLPFGPDQVLPVTEVEDLTPVGMDTLIPSVHYVTEPELNAALVGLTYSYHQTAPAATWTITHNLHSWTTPTILLDSDPDSPVLTDVAIVDGDTQVLTFPSPVTGWAHFRK